MGNDEIKVNEDKPIKKNKGFFSKGIDVLLFSILSFLLIPLWYLALLTSVYSIIRAIIVIKKTGSKLAKAGLILGIISTTLTSLIYTQIIAAIFYEYS